jgi:hypothetical protein
VIDDIKEGCSIIEKQAELLKVKFGLLGLVKIEINCFYSRTEEEENQRNFFKKLVKNNSRTCG